MSLSPALKQLLKQRSPNALVSPGLRALGPVLGATLREAAQKKAEKGWLCVATATFLTANSPSAVGELYTYVTHVKPPPDASKELLSKNERVEKAALMREAALKCAVFVGVPRVINSLAGFHEALDDEVRASLRTEGTRALQNTREGPDAVRERGNNLFDSVYHPHTKKLLDKLASYHPDFADFIINQEYGALLSDPVSDWPTVGRVGRALTSATGVACLRADGGVGPQLTSHVYGLLKAQGYEPKAKDVGPGEEWIATEEGATWILGVVDRLKDALLGVSGEASASPKL